MNFLLEPLMQKVRALLSQPDYVPLRDSELAATLHVRGSSRHLLRKALRQLEESGDATCSQDRRWSPAGAIAAATKASSSATPRGPTIRGVFRVRINGTCWLMPDRGADGALSLNSKETEWVLHGDRVEAVVDAVPSVRSRMFEGVTDREEMRPGHVVRILERRRKQLVGILRVFGDHYAYVVPKDPLIRQNVQLTDEVSAVREHSGHLVSIALQQPDEVKEGAPVKGRFVADLGDPEDARTDIPAILQDHARSEVFPAAVEAAARAIQSGTAPVAAPPVADGSPRHDLRDRCIVTIDPADAHDYDDAVGIASRHGGGWTLGVHIADVPAYVVPGGPIDDEALHRGNSAYLVDRVIRMLPEDLTVHACSLQPAEDHLTHTVEIVFSPDATPLAVRTYRSIIRSRARLSYEQVQGFFDGNANALPPPVAGDAEVLSSLRALRALATKLRARRFADGALDFALPEVHCLLDARGEPTGFAKRGAAESYGLIEECMLAANRAVAEKLHESGWPCVYRIHDEPAPDQWARMEAELRALGVHLGARTADELNRIARAAVGTPGQYMVTLTLLRNLQRATYSTVAAGHFGLGFRHYCHFTSPIRRYPDLIVHRILTALEDGRPCPYTKGDIDALALHCADAEREAADMESQSLAVKRIRYYANMLRAGHLPKLAGTVIGLNPKGLIIELGESLQQGMLPYSAMGKERYILAPDDFVASTARGSSYRLGQPVDVILAAVDEDKRRVDFALPHPPRAARTSRKSPAKSPAKTSRSRRPRRR